LRVWRRNRR